MGRSPPYFLRLRIYARQIGRFYQKLRELDPVYDNCPVRCLAPEADKKNGCPDCDYTVFRKKAKDNYYRILKRDLKNEYLDAGASEKLASTMAEQDLKKWSFETMGADYRAFSELEALAGTQTEDNPGGFDPNWNVRVDTGIAIIREERYKVRREKRHEDKQKAEADARAKARLKAT